MKESAPSGRARQIGSKNSDWFYHLHANRILEILKVVGRQRRSQICLKAKQLKSREKRSGG